MSLEIKAAYDHAAVAYRRRYDSIPPRIEDVDLVFKFINKTNPVVVEIGCAYGREVHYILTKTNNYTGLDISQKFIEMAKKELPASHFICTDVMDYTFVPGIDVVFAFASLLHNSKEDIRIILARVSEALNQGGVIFLSLKRRDEYESAIESDDLVSRRFYYYTRQTILDAAPANLKEIFYHEQSRKEAWFTMILKKV